MSRAGKWFGNLFILVWLVMLVGIAGVRWEFLPLQAGLLMAALGAAIAVIYGVLLLPVVLFKLLLRKPLASSSLTMCILGLLPAAILVATVGPAGLNAPAIHDVATDTENPPRFVLAAEERTASDNPVAYEGEVIARLQHEAYPDLAPLVTDKPPEAVLETVVKTVEEEGWRVLGTRTSEEPGVVGVVEAVASSALFGFEDDVAIRVAETGAGSRIDIRSASRVGLGDLGANAARVRALKTALTEKM